MCPWCLNECKSNYAFFFAVKISHVAALQMTEGWNRSVDMHTVYDFHYFPGPLNGPMFNLKVSITSPLVSRNCRCVPRHPPPLPPPKKKLCMKSEPPDVIFGRFWFHLVLCISLAVWQCSSQGVVFLWCIIRGYQHNTSLNTLEYIPSNPQHTAIRGSRLPTTVTTQTYHWSAKVSGNERGSKERGR